MTTPRKLGPLAVLGVLVAPFLVAYLLVQWPTSLSDNDVSGYRADLLRQCQADVACWGSRFQNEAQWPCQDAIERAAPFDYRWINGFGRDKFPGWRTPRMAAMSNEGYVTYYGDSLMLQNGYGAWSRNVYECDYLPGAGTVMGVRVHRGRIPAEGTVSSTESVLRAAEKNLAARGAAAGTTEK